MLYTLSALLKCDMNVADFWQLQLFIHPSESISNSNTKCKW